MMDMRDEWLRGLRSWAAANGNVRELWLFGSRAKGCARLDSDVDIALSLVPPAGKTDWAFGNFVALGKTWQAELEAIVGRHVSLTLVNDQIDTRILLWARPASPGDNSAAVV